MSDEPDLAARLHGVGGEGATHPVGGAPEHRTLGTVVEPDGVGPLGRMAELIRHRPVVLVAVVVAGFLLGRLARRVARSTH
ncbi:MAG: hypothetical protein WCA46_30280 [Actinocatenispora sp.]